jgi:hypothetical protein
VEIPPQKDSLLKLRIAIVVIGLLAGLAARAAVDFYDHFRAQRSITPPAASASPVIDTKNSR